MVTGILSALVAFAPALVKLALYIMDQNGASQVQKRKFLDMVLLAQDDALESSQMKDQFAILRQELKDAQSGTTPSKNA
jgi:hypothetical protein